MAHQQVAFQLVRMACGPATRGQRPERLGHEQIWLSGIGISAHGRVQKAQSIPIDPHSYSGAGKVFRPSKTLFDFDVPENGRFPRACAVELLLAETDRDAPVPPAVKRVDCPVRQRALHWLNRFMSERRLLVQHVSLEIPSGDFEWPGGTKMSPEVTLEFRGQRGIYHLTFLWEIRSS